MSDQFKEYDDAENAGMVTPSPPSSFASHSPSPSPSTYVDIPTQVETSSETSSSSPLGSYDNSVEFNMHNKRVVICPPPHYGMPKTEDMYHFLTRGENYFVFGIVADEGYFLGGTQKDEGIKLIKRIKTDEGPVYYNIAGLLGIPNYLLLVDRLIIDNIFSGSRRPNSNKHGFNRIWLFGKSDTIVHINGEEHNLCKIYEYVNFTACVSEKVNVQFEMHRGGKTRKRSYRKKQTRRR
jgi:hypothetical protein